MTRIIADMFIPVAPYFLTAVIVIVCAIITAGNLENRRW